jgi:hypothetical protein
MGSARLGYHAVANQLFDLLVRHAQELAQTGRQPADGGRRIGEAPGGPQRETGADDRVFHLLQGTPLAQVQTPGRGSAVQRS